MKRDHSALLLGAVGLMIVLGLTVGCYRKAAPDVEPTAAGGAQVAPTGEVTPDATAIMATAQAQSTQQATEVATEAPPAETPTELVPTEPPPTEESTPVPPTAEPTVEAPTPEPTPIPTSPPSGEVTHIVQRGENLFRIALLYGTTVEAIASANGIANPALIYVGQTLIIPVSGTQPVPQPGGESTYVVKPGDNLFRIALRYNMSYLYLAQYNGIADPSRIYVGQVLRIPPR